MPWAGGGPGCWWFLWLRTVAEAWETLLDCLVQSTPFPDEVVQLHSLTSEDCILFATNLLFYSLLKVVFQVAMFLLMQIYVSHSFEKYLFLYNICEF